MSPGSPENSEGVMGEAEGCGIVGGGEEFAKFSFTERLRGGASGGTYEESCRSYKRRRQKGSC